MKYHGWKNYATWATFTWLTNEERTYRKVLGVIRDKETPEAAAALRDFVMLWIPEVEDLPGLFYDLLEYVLGEEVDWVSIVEALREEK